MFTNAENEITRNGKIIAQCGKCLLSLKEFSVLAKDSSVKIDASRKTKSSIVLPVVHEGEDHGYNIHHQVEYIDKIVWRGTDIEYCCHNPECQLSFSSVAVTKVSNIVILVFL